MTFDVLLKIIEDTDEQSILCLTRRWSTKKQPQKIKRENGGEQGLQAFVPCMCRESCRCVGASRLRLNALCVITASHLPSFSKAECLLCACFIPLPEVCSGWILSTLHGWAVCAYNLNWFKLLKGIRREKETLLFSTCFMKLAALLSQRVLFLVVKHVINCKLTNDSDSFILFLIIYYNAAVPCTSAWYQLFHHSLQ